MPDSLDLALQRNLILLMGGEGSGKSRSVAELIKAGEGKFNVVLIDFDGRIRKSIQTVIGHVPENLDYFLADTWGKVIEGVEHAFNVLDAGDWLVFEMMGSMWERATEYFSEEVYGESKADRLVSLRAEAEQGLKGKKAARSGEALKERQASVAFGGYEGRTDYVPIKAQHNGKIRDRLTTLAPFNILATTAAAPVSSEDEKRFPKFASFGFRPDGEKNNAYKFDTVAYCQRKGDKFLWRTDLVDFFKDEGHERVKDVDFTGKGFIQSYYEHFGLEL